MIILAHIAHRLFPVWLRSSRSRADGVVSVAALASPIGALLAIALLLASVASAPASASPKLLLVGDSWAEFMLFHDSMGQAFAANGHPQLETVGALTSIGGTTAAFWAEPNQLALIDGELAAHPETQWLQLTVGGNDFGAGAAGGGWHTGLDAAASAALFDSIATDVATIVDHLLAAHPDLIIVLSLYDYANLVESLTLGLAGPCTDFWNNVGQPDSLVYNTALTAFTQRLAQLTSGRPRLRHVSHLGLMQFQFGFPDQGIAPGDLPLPGDLNRPSPIESMHEQQDCVHQSQAGYLAVAEHLFQRVYAGLLGPIHRDGFEAGTPTVVDAQGHSYRSVRIGTQLWLAQNLRTVVVDSWSYADDPGHDPIYGRLYNQSAAISACAALSGWRLPSDGDWMVLEAHLGMDPAELQLDWTQTEFRGADEGGQLKQTGTTLWTSPNSGATDIHGFEALPGGFLGVGGGYDSLGSDGRYWSTGASRYFRADRPHLNRYFGSPDYGFSVRCMRED